MNRTSLRHTLRVLALFATVPAALHAAPPPAAPPIVGVVRDTAGVPLPNARVVIQGLGRATTTTADGRFTFGALRAGRYHLDVSLIGYAPADVEVMVPPEGPPVAVTITLVPTPLALSGLQVTASPAGEDPLRITQSTVQLSGKELGRNLRATVAQTLADQPGISTRYAGPGASTPVIRGLSGERVLVLQDGQRAADLSSTSSDHGLSIDPLAATQLEVVRGPASLLYGNNALGGVVNVISNDIPTSVPAHLEGYLASQAESVNPGGAVTGSVTVPVGDAVAFTLRGGGRSLDDVRVGDGGTLPNTQFSNLHGVAGMGYVGEGVSAGLAYRGYGFDYGLPAPADAEEAGVTIEGVRHEATGRSDLSFGQRNLRHLRLEGTAQWYRHDEIEPSGEVGTTFNLRTQTVGVTGRTVFGRFDGALGVSGLFKQYTPEGEEALTPSADSKSGGVFVFQETALGGSERAPKLQFGARYDLYRIESDDGGERFGPARTRDFGNVSGSLGVNIPLRDDVSVSASVARAFRAPTVEELFSNAFHAAVGSFDVGNPDLEAETNQGIDAVLRVQRPRFNAQLSAFANRIDHYIAPTLVGDTTIEEDGEAFAVPLNVFRQEDAALRGVEGQIEATVAPNLVLGGMGDLIRGRFEDDEPLPYMPAARLGGSARWDNGRFSFGGQARHVFAQNDVPLNEAGTDDYTLVDLSAGATLIFGGRVHSLTLRADNAFDVLYREATSRIKDFAPNPGRNLSLVYRVLF